MKKITILISILTIFTPSIFYSSNFNKEFNFQEDTSWKYLGQVRPGMTPLRFPPDSLLATSSWMWHGTPIFSPNLKEMFWCRYNRVVNIGELAFIKYVNGNWTPMQYVPFGNRNVWENNPFFSPSGDTLFFMSVRGGGFIYRVCRTSSGWTEPEPVIVPIPSGYTNGFSFSIARNGTIYFELFLTGQNTHVDIYKSRLVNGQYQTPENLGNIVNSDSSETAPFIDPYERYILFSSKRAGGYGLHDVYVSKRNTDSTWDIPINLGPAINTSFEDVFPFVTPDSLYFFYATARTGDIGYNPYWVSMQLINNIISIGIKPIGKTVSINYKLSQNYPNPFNPSTSIEFALPKTSYTKLIIYDLLGKEIETLVNEELKAGSYKIEFDGGKLSSGVYLYKLTTPEYIETKRMVMIK